MRPGKRKSSKRFSIFNGTPESQIAMTYLAAYLTAAAFICFLYFNGVF